MLSLNSSEATHTHTINHFNSHSDNFNNISSILLIGALGLDHFNHCPRHIKSNVIGVDLCSRGIILAGWKTGVESSKEIQVYNAASMRDFSFSILNTMSNLPREFETMKVVAPCYGFSVTNPVLCFICRLFVVWIPFLVLDGLLMIFKQKPMLMKVSRIIQNVYASLHHFVMHQFQIDNFKFWDLNKDLSPAEKDEFGIILKSKQRDVCESFYKFVIEHVWKDNAERRAKAKQIYPLKAAYHYGFLSLYVFIIYKAISLISFS